MDRKHCRKRRKWWLPAFSPFPIMFSEGFFFWGSFNIWDYVIRGFSFVIWKQKFSSISSPADIFFGLIFNNCIMTSFASAEHYSCSSRNAVKSFLKIMRIHSIYFSERNWSFQVIIKPASIKGGYFDFSHLPELKDIYISQKFIWKKNTNHQELRILKLQMKKNLMVFP